MKKLFNLLITIAAMSLLIVGCSSKNNQSTVDDKPIEPTHTGTIILENGGEMEFELYGDIAPKTVDNFVELANNGFYDGLIFHRVIENFMIQGGDPQGTGMGGSENTIVGEFNKNGVSNPIKHERGIMSMARKSNNMDSASSQFFIVQSDATHLDGDYAAFGKVVRGMEVVDEIAAVETNSADKPIEDIVIKNIVID